MKNVTSILQITMEINQVKIITDRDFKIKI